MRQKGLNIFRYIIFSLSAMLLLLMTTHSLIKHILGTKKILSLYKQLSSLAQPNFVCCIAN
jgi:hypothetical protein